MHAIVKTYRILILLGLVLYVVSFFLTAVKDANASATAPGYKGYLCAFVALVVPWGHDGMPLLHENPAEYFGILLSGWINPVFVITAVALLFRPNGRFAGILRIVLLLMFPACWIVFYRAHLRPAAGYFLWTAAMLVVLFSNYIAGGRAEKAVDNRRNLP